MTAQDVAKNTGLQRALSLRESVEVEFITRLDGRYQLLLYGIWYVLLHV
jgi:hypothetical protein